MTLAATIMRGMAGLAYQDTGKFLGVRECKSGHTFFKREEYI